MFRYYFSIALRNAFRHRLYSFISIVGLCLGLTAIAMVGIYTQDELSYDRWIPDADDIYVVMVNFQSQRANATPSDLGLWIRQDYPQLKGVTRVFARSHQLSHGDLHFTESIAWADANFFEVFALEAIAGNLDKALAEPGRLVLTETAARKYFNDEDALGQTLVLDREHPMQVAAIIKDVPSNTHFTLSIMAPGHTQFSPLLEQDNNPVSGYLGRKLWAINTYIKVNNQADAVAIQSDLDPLIDRRLPISEGRPNSEIYELELLPIPSIHLAPRSTTQGTRDLSTLTTIFAISAMILVAACINYVNLMTARGMKRAPEIAIRKTVGATSNQLMKQLLMESTLLVVVSFCLALLLAFIVLPTLNGFLNREIQIEMLQAWQLFGLGGIVVLLTVLLAGVYPALVLSHLSPIATITYSSASRRSTVRRAIVRHVLSVVQFAILTGLIIGTIVIYQQSRFAISEAMNQTVNPVVVVFTDCDDAVKQAFSRVPEINSASCARQIPQWGLGPSTGFQSVGETDRRITVNYGAVDTGFFELFDLELAAGRNFDEARSTDIIRDASQFNTITSVIVNEQLVRDLSLASPGAAIGERFQWSRSYQSAGPFSPLHQVEIIGVLKDFQVGSVRQATPASVFYVQRDQGNIIAVELDGQQLERGLAGLDAAWESVYPNQPINRVFFNETIDRMYQDMTRQATILTVCAVVALAIASLGLVGLAAFVAEKRSKEIGIRKVLGSSSLGVVGLLLLQFSKPVLISNFLAWPLSYYAMSQWLESFTSHVTIDPLIFLGASLATLVLALLTVIAHSLTVSNMNPVDALRYE